MQNLGFNQLLVRKADMIQAASFLLAVLINHTTSSEALQKTYLGAPVLSPLRILGKPPPLYPPCLFFQFPDAPKKSHAHKSQKE